MEPSPKKEERPLQVVVALLRKGGTEIEPLTGDGEQKSRRRWGFQDLMTDLEERPRR